MSDRIIKAVVPVALTETIEALEPEFEDVLGLRLTTQSMLNPEVPSYLSQGAAWDIAFSNPWHLQEVLDYPNVEKGSHRPLGRAPLAFAVRGHGPRPANHSSQTDIEAALVAADKIAITRGGTSGDMFGKLIERLGLSNQLPRKTVELGGGEPMKALLAHDVDLAVLPLSNIAPRDGVYPKVIVPAEYQVHVDLSLCLSSRANPNVIKMYDWLTHGARAERLAELGLDRLDSLKPIS